MQRFVRNGNGAGYITFIQFGAFVVVPLFYAVKGTGFSVNSFRMVLCFSNFGCTETRVASTAVIYIKHHRANVMMPQQHKCH